VCRTDRTQITEALSKAFFFTCAFVVLFVLEGIRRRSSGMWGLPVWGHRLRPSSPDVAPSLVAAASTRLEENTQRYDGPKPTLP
jgi:hypothetical protein